MIRVKGKLGIRLPVDPVEQMAQASLISDPAQRAEAYAKIAPTLTVESSAHWQERRINDALLTLAQRFPVIRDRLPIAIGTDFLAACSDMPRSIVRSAVYVFTHRAAYLKALSAPGAMRHTLDGTPVEPVTEEHAGIAQQKLKELLSYHRNRHKNNVDAAMTARTSPKSLRMEA